MQGARAQRDLEIADNLDVSLGKHSVRAGVFVEGAFVTSTVTQNANGTFTFESLDDYEAGAPRTFTVRQGDPLVDYSMWQFGWYAQDDIRLRKDLTLSVGVRHEWQSHLDDWDNVAPRVGFAWSPYEK